MIEQETIHIHVQSPFLSDPSTCPVSVRHSEHILLARQRRRTEFRRFEL
jgi:hypothetical protein